MKRTALITLLCVLLPLVVLGGWTATLLYERATAQEYHVIVEGYDPNDILHGRYIRLRYVWDHKDSDKPAIAHDALPQTAQFYVPEWDAPELETMLQSREHVFAADIIVMGKRTQIRSLQIDGKPWEESLDAWRQKRNNTIP